MVRRYSRVLGQNPISEILALPCVITKYAQRLRTDLKRKVQYIRVEYGCVVETGDST